MSLSRRNSDVLGFHFDPIDPEAVRPLRNPFRDSIGSQIILTEAEVRASEDPPNSPFGSNPESPAPECEDLTSNPESPAPECEDLTTTLSSPTCAESDGCSEAAAATDTPPDPSLLRVQHSAGDQIESSTGSISTASQSPQSSGISTPALRRQVRAAFNRPTLELSVESTEALARAKVKYASRLRTKLIDPSSLRHHTRTKMEEDRYQQRQAGSLWIFLIMVAIGLALSAFVMWTAMLDPSVPTQKLCLAFEDHFDGDSLDLDAWQHEVRADGWGNGEFQITTTSEENSFVGDGMLHIVPTLTTDRIGEAALLNGTTFKLNESQGPFGKCTATATDVRCFENACMAVSNSITGSIIPPILSARLRSKRAIRYGRIEVRAKMPTGDWLWPAIWMLPQEEIYGEWPRSGEIDIAESAGNLAQTKRDLRATSTISSTLHWGSSAYTDRWWLTSAHRRLLQKYYNDEFHTFGMDWSPEGIAMWDGTPRYRIMWHKFRKQGFFVWGKIPGLLWNGTASPNPWSTNPRVQNPAAAPFDQPFYLILNVAVGGTNGWFAESLLSNKAAEEKPWSDSSPIAARMFWNQREKWLPSWPTDLKRRGMLVDYVRMYERC